MGQKEEEGGRGEKEGVEFEAEVNDYLEEEEVEEDEEEKVEEFENVDKGGRRENERGLRGEEKKRDQTEGERRRKDRGLTGEGRRGMEGEKKEREGIQRGGKGKR